MTEIDEELVRELLREQHPELAGLELHQAVRGWDNQMWRLGDELAVRLPMTPRGPELLRSEQRWLPELAERLPLPVPTPVRVGEPSDRYPKTWSVVKWVPGEPADRTPISAGSDGAETLAEFLLALHQEAPAEAPPNPSRGVPLKLLADEVEKGFEALADHIPAGAREIWADALAAGEHEGPDVWLHGDLHPANVVVADGALSGVIDFGELGGGDPATDLAAAWVLLPDGEAKRLFELYSRADEHTVRRARGWAVRQSLMLVSVGLAGDRGLPGGKPTWRPAGQKAIARVLAHDA